MNIFKTLASGSGSINEPNVSAFLGYLLNPKEDHGLGDTFLKKFLEPLLRENDKLDFMRDRNLSIRSNFEIEVLLEQAFKDDSKKDDNESNQIVDIVILCYEKKSQKGKFLAKDIIIQKKEGAGIPKHIFLIENKIKDESVDVKNKQLEKQYKQTIVKLNHLLDITNSEDLVSVIFVTPGGINAITEFENFKKTNNKIHLHLPWHTNNDDYSISKMIKEILEKGTQPIDVCCKHTLQAFWEFIENDFKSTITEELEVKNKDYTLYDFGNDKNLKKNGLVRAVIAKYIDDHKGSTLKDLQKVFPRELSGDRKRDCVIDAQEAIKEVNTPNKNGNTYRYYFIKPEELIELEDKQKVAILDWWDKYNLPIFIEKAEELGYTITEI